MMTDGVGVRREGWDEGVRTRGEDVGRAGMSRTGGFGGAGPGHRGLELARLTMRSRMSADTCSRDCFHLRAESICRLTMVFIH